ncbi:MAG: zf-HC2 domain-containing protein [bacterium]
MKCTEIQELLLTDYMDKETDEKQRTEVQNHVLACARCTQVMLNIREKAVNPFKKAAVYNPPEAVWYKIVDVLSHEKLGVMGRLKDIAAGFVNRKRLLVAGASLVIIFMAIMVFRQPATNTYVTQDVSQEQDGLFLLLDDTSDFNDTSVEFGTDVEEYFM